MTARLCLEGGHVLTTNRSGRCDDHERMAARQHHNKAYDTPEWAARQAATLAAWRSQNGERCPGWGEPSHYATPDNPLTVDHTLGLARGGEHRQSLGVLCRRCNGRKGATQMQEDRRDRRRPIRR